jgi:PhoH-like ATPase
MTQFVLDTNVLLYDPNALYAFEQDVVVIPLVVVEDIGRMKKDPSETGRNARESSRILDELRQKGSLVGGVRLSNGGSLRVHMSSEETLRRLPRDLREQGRDSLLLSTVMDIQRGSDSPRTVLVSKDLNLRIKADALGIEVMDFEAERVDIDELYAGMSEQTLPVEAMDAFVASGAIELPGKLYPNQYFVFHCREDAARVEYARYDAERGVAARLLSINEEGVYRLKPRNEEQRVALDALLDDSIQLVTLVGKAGTGKTLLAVAASLYKTIEQNVYGRILVSRPTLPMGKDIGFLPGTVEEKLTPWMYPIADNVEYLMRAGSKARQKSPGFRELIDAGILVIEPLTFIRGRSIHNQFLIVDEAQNLTPHEIKTIITRVGDGTKTIVTGDPYQIDNPYIDSSSNGLAYLVDKFKDQPISAHVTLRKGERSRLSELAANLL